MDANGLISGVPVVVLVPAAVEAMKRAGLPVRYAGLAAMAVATLLVALAELAAPGGSAGLAAPARWLLAGMVYGLAGAGLYTQARRFPGVERAAGEATTDGRGDGTRLG